jgi:HSP20 family protein
MTRSALIAGVNPFARLLQLQDALETTLREPAGGFSSGLLGRGAFPPVNILRDDDGCVVRLEVPGLDSESICIQSQGQTLTVTGKRSNEGAPGTLHRNERWSGEFERSIELPRDLVPAKATAAYRHGVLSIRVPVREDAKPQRIAIEAS